MYDEVLLPTDGSESAERAARRGAVLADAYDASVHVLSVVDERDYAGVGSDEADTGKTAAEREAQAAVETAAGIVEGSGSAVTTRVTVGIPSEEILAYAAAEGIDLVAMGTHGRTGVERFIIGSVAERVVRHADIPVLTVRHSETTPEWPPIDRLLVPTDGSDASYRALPVAFDLADRFDAVVEGLSIVDERSKANVYTVETALEEMVGGLEATAQSATERIESRARAADVAVTTTVTDGIPSRTICAHAEESAADLIVIASHGRTGLAHYLLGSVAERVVRNSSVPVLTVPGVGAE